MQTFPYPFNKNQHIFDFKVKVNFENGNVSLSAPQIVSPPAYFAPPITHLPPTQRQVNIIPQNIITPPLQQNNSFDSFRSSQFPINDSMQIIECVICQKTFNVNEFDEHLSFHKQKRPHPNIIQHQSVNKELTSNGVMVTQNSFNNSNDSFVSSGSNCNKQEYSFKNNHSHMSQNLSQHSSSQVENSYERKVQQQQNLPQSQNVYIDQRNIVLGNNESMRSNKSGQLNNQNQSLQLLGQIQNPILLIKQQNQQSFGSIRSQNPNISLDYSKSSCQQIHPRFQGPNSSNSNGYIINPLQMNNHNLHNDYFNQSGTNSFGQNQLIGPSFYHSQNNSNHSLNNISSHSHLSNQVQHYSSSNSSQCVQEIKQNQNGNFLRHFQSIESRCIVQPVNQNGVMVRGSSMNNQSMNLDLYLSQQDIPTQKLSKGPKSHESKQFFNDDSISSISNTSRISMSQYSDFQELRNNPHNHPLKQQSSENNINVKNTKPQHLRESQQVDKISLIRSQGLKNSTKNEQKNAFMKKKKQHMINSTTSYYDRKFKDQVSSSSDQDQHNAKNVRLSYAERVKEKKSSDANQNFGKSLSSTKNFKKSQKMIASKISQTSNMSKTKLPVNYLAREDFISTSSKTSKSTHKSTVKN